MEKILVYYAHPGHKYSNVNRAMAERASALEGVSFVDLYADYPRHNVDIDREQERLVTHDVILFQFPLFWYSTPSLIKEWQDLVLEYGFAYGHEGTQLEGKDMMLAVSTAGPQDAFNFGGYQTYPLTTFLAPLEQTARICKMNYLPPYVLHTALTAPKEDRVEAHVDGYGRLLVALRDGTYDRAAAGKMEMIFHDGLPIAKNGIATGGAS
ncbi:Kef-type potassium/proton antiporter accessory protein, CPA2 family [Cohaesibacter sp. ES.047]|uniref:NAD(P)H-dependent oxidoreductase n=1 Tax=Cohaesibacter sp. ES.047 TaxID=1798205 RepID=UPI000BB93480|nr:NAD(P)H-dependent oxidoreductase [Cohaesibacter sp. ES.047]SNY91232.1 Kef-type potassium/proton antiporter accessory protein, CPA2 family [Cohaesibacter sp. ES.047]